jgi:tight adherence protein B
MTKKMETLEFPLLKITSSWQYLMLFAGCLTAIYLIIIEQFGHFLYWRNWRKKVFSFFLILPKKETTVISLERKKGFSNYIRIFLKLFILLIIGICITVLTSFLWGSLCFIFLGITGFFLKNIQKSNQKKEIMKQFPIFLQTIRNALSAGYSFEKALSFVANEIDTPLKKEILIINQKLQFHIPLPEALTDFSKKIDHPDVNFFVESTNIQLKTGGNLIHLFHKVSNLLEARNELSRNIKSFTSQGRMSGIVIASLWPISLILFSLLSSNHTHILFKTTQGQFLLILSFCLEWIGFFFIWKIIRIKL